MRSRGLGRNSLRFCLSLCVLLPKLSIASESQDQFASGTVTVMATVVNNPRKWPLCTEIVVTQGLTLGPDAHYYQIDPVSHVVTQDLGKNPRVEIQLTKDGRVDRTIIPQSLLRQQQVKRIETTAILPLDPQIPRPVVGQSFTSSLQPGSRGSVTQVLQIGKATVQSAVVDTAGKPVAIFRDWSGQIYAGHDGGQFVNVGRFLDYCDGPTDSPSFKFGLSVGTLKLDAQSRTVEKRTDSYWLCDYKGTVLKQARRFVALSEGQAVPALCDLGAKELANVKGAIYGEIDVTSDPLPIIYDVVFDEKSGQPKFANLRTSDGRSLDRARSYYAFVGSREEFYGPLARLQTLQPRSHLDIDDVILRIDNGADGTVHTKNVFRDGQERPNAR